MKTLQTIIIAILAYSSLHCIAAAQYATLQGAGSVSVATGKVIEVINFLGANGTLSYQKTGGTKIDLLLSLPPSSASTPLQQHLFLAGPGTLTTTNNAGTVTTLCNYILSDQPAATSTGIPSTAVVIPTNATGQVNIILESSTDLVTWVTATPGSYGAATQNRFFRVRAQ